MARGKKRECGIQKGNEGGVLAAAWWRRRHLTAKEEGRHTVQSEFGRPDEGLLCVISPGFPPEGPILVETVASAGSGCSYASTVGSPVTAAAPQKKKTNLEVQQASKKREGTEGGVKVSGRHCQD